MYLLFAFVLFFVCTPGVSGTTSPCTYSGTGSTSCTRAVVINGTSMKFPVLSTQGLQSTDSAITRAFIWLHGFSRDARGAFNTATDSADSVGVSYVDTVIIVPWFFVVGDTDLPATSATTTWLNFTSDWADGLEAVGVTPSITSYFILDNILTNIAVSFPNLEKVTVMGHSAGAQATHRWSYISTITNPTSYLRASRTPTLKFRFIVANPSSYLYLSTHRLDYNLWSSCMGSPTAPVPSPPCTYTASSFLATWNGAGSGCGNTWDRFKYGVTNTSSFVGYIAANPITSAAALSKTSSLSHVFMAGTQDIILDSVLDDTCRANAQGGFVRYVRQQTFIAYMNLIVHPSYPLPFGPATLIEQNCDHSASCMFYQASGAPRVIFDPAWTINGVSYYNFI